LPINYHNENHKSVFVFVLFDMNVCKCLFVGAAYM